MRHESLDRVREALARLPTASRADLGAEWLRLYRTEPPARLGRELLIAAIGYRIQEAALGGLRPELQRRLRHIAEQVSRGERPGLNPQYGSSITRLFQRLRSTLGSRERTR